MKNSTLLTIPLTIIFFAGCNHSQQSPQYQPSAITLTPNQYSLKENYPDLDSMPFRQVVLYWEAEPELPYFSEFIVHSDYVSALIDSVAVFHLDPKVNIDTGKKERRLVGVNVREPAESHSYSSYNVPELVWVSVATWHRN